MIRRIFTLLPAIALWGLSGCTLSLTEQDIFLPNDAKGTLFTLKDDDRVIFELNKANPDIWADFDVARMPGVFEGGDGKLSYRLARNGKAEDPPLIVYCGGNSFDVPNHGDLAIWKAIPHGDVLVWDYPGFGDSEGEATVAAFRRAVVTVSAKLDRVKRSPDQRVVLWGQSLGGFVCSELAGHIQGLDQMVIETSAPSAEAAATYFGPWWARPFINISLSPELQSFDNVQALAKSSPLNVLILAAGKDEILPVQLSRNLRDELSAAGHKVTYHEFRKADHLSIGFEKRLTEIVAGFFRETT